MAFDRLMARLLVAAPNRWIVKGGVALDFRLGERARTTKDLDLARRDNEDAAMVDLLTAASIDLGDHFTFLIERTESLDAALEGAAVRYRVTATLAGRRFETFGLDIGFSASHEFPPDTLQGPGHFVFAGIEPIEVPAIPLALHVAEKLHAYTRLYSDDRTSSRVKDLVDIVLIQSTANFNAGHLKHAIDYTFSSRTTQPIPTAIPSPPSSWRLSYRKMAAEVSLDPDLDEGFKLAAEFLDPILSHSLSDTANWKPITGAWEPPLDSTSIDRR